MRRLKDAAGCLFSFLALALFIVGVPFGVWQTFSQRSLPLGLAVVAYVAVLVGMFLLGVRLTGATGGIYESLGVRKHPSGPPPEWRIPTRPVG